MNINILRQLKTVLDWAREHAENDDRFVPGTYKKLQECQRAVNAAIDGYDETAPDMDRVMECLTTALHTETYAEFGLTGVYNWIEDAITELEGNPGECPECGGDTDNPHDFDTYGTPTCMLCGNPE